MPPRMIETREVLAPFVGQWVHCHGTVMRDAIFGRHESFVARINAYLDGEWVRVASHAWVVGERLCRTWGSGVEIEFDALVRTYVTNDPTTGQNIDRYGLQRPCNVVSHGRADLREFVGELVTVWGWERVADAVAAAHGGTR